MKFPEHFEIECKAKAYDATLKNFKKKLEKTDDKIAKEHLKFAIATMRMQYKYIKSTHNQKE